MVDDDADHVVIICAVLASLAPDVQVHACADGASLLARLAQTPSGALLLIDRRLGCTESFPTIAEVHRLRSDLPIGILSAALSVADRARALAVGACDAVEKPASVAGWRSLLDPLLVVPERGYRAA